MFYQEELQEIYCGLRANLTLNNSEALNSLSNPLLGLKSVTEKNFDVPLLELILANDNQLKQDTIERFRNMIQYLQQQTPDPNSQIDTLNSSAALKQLLDDKQNCNNFQKNLSTILKLISKSLTSASKTSYSSTHSQTSFNQIQTDQPYAKYQDLLETLNWFVRKFVDQQLRRGPHLKYLDSLSEYAFITRSQRAIIFSKGLKNFILDSNLSTLFDTLPDLITRSLHHKLYDKSLFAYIFDNFPAILQNDQAYYEAQEQKPTASLYKQLERSITMIKVIKTVLPKNLQQQSIDQLNQYGFLIFQKSLKYFDLSGATISFEFLLKLLKSSRDELGSQVDMLSKNKMQKYFKEMFEVLVYNFHKVSLTQLTDFCAEIQSIRTISFDLLNQINFFHMVCEISYKFNSLLQKISGQFLQMQNIKDDQMIQEFLQLKQKLKYMINQIELLFVKSFYFDDAPTKAANERRVHQIVQLWNCFFENKADPFLEVETWKQEQFNNSPIFSQIQKQFNNKYEENLIKRISFLQIANKFLLQDKNKATSFSSSIIIDLVLPKLDLSSILAQVIVLQQKAEKPSLLTTQYLIKLLYKFFFNLLANTKAQDLREKALKDLPKSISLFFTSISDDIISQLKFNLLDYVAAKIESNYYQCSPQEQLQFFIEILQALNQQFFRIEDEFLFSVESCKGTVEGMRQLSLFRQIVQKAQGQEHQNLSLGSIMEKKVIDYKKAFQLVPLVSKCSSIFTDTSFTQLRLKAAQLIAEFWVYVVINNPYMIINRKKSLKKERLTNDEAKDLIVYIDILKDLYGQMGKYLNKIAFMTPNLLSQNKVSVLDLKIVTLLTENRTTYTCQNFYFYNLHNQMKTLFQLKKKEFKNKLELQDLIYIVQLNEIFQRCIESIQRDVSILQNADQSFVNKFIGFVKSEDEEEPQHIEITSIQITHQQIQSQINKQVKFQSFLKESITRAAVQYTQYLLTQKGTLTKNIIVRDFIYLIQHSSSIDKTLSEYACNMCVDFIRNFPFVCFSPDVLKTFTELLTILYQKIGREFDSKSKPIQNEQFKYKVLLNTDQKILTQNIVFLMNCLLKLVFRGLYIDHNFVKVLCLHLIKQETSLMSELPFGYKFLKFMISSLKVDKDAIEAFKDQADRYNPYFWLVKEVEFDNKISSSDLTQFVVDKGLLRLQRININQRIQFSLAQEILKSIDYSIKNEIEFDFHAEDRFAISNQISPIMKEIVNRCQELNICHYFNINKPQTNQRLLRKLQELDIEISDFVLQLAKDNSNYKKVKSRLIREMLACVTSLKSIMLNNNQQIKGVILTQLLDISKFYLQPQLLKYVLMRLIPFLHSISPNYFDSTFFFLLGEMLHYTVYQINNLGNLKYDRKVSSADIFQIKINYFNSLLTFEIEEINEDYLKNLSDSRYPINLVNLAQIGYYEIRWKCLCKIHEILIRFLNDNMQIHLVKNVKLSIIANILKLNFLVDKKIVEFIPLENVCQVLKGSIEIIQLMKEFKEKFGSVGDIEVLDGKDSFLHPYSIKRNLEVKFDIEVFYYKTLKFGLSHFAKNVTLYNEPLYAQCSNQSRLVRRHQLYAMVCKYLSKDKLHEINEEAKITKLKRVKKRFSSVVFKSHRKEMLTIDNGVHQTIVIDTWAPAARNRRIYAEIGYGQQQLYSISFHQQGGPGVRPYYLRKALFYLLCDELDKIKAFAIKLSNELNTDYSLLSQNKLSNNFIMQMISEIPDKNLNLAYQIIVKLFPLMQSDETLNEILYRYLGSKVATNYYQYLDCPHFFDIMVCHHLQNIDSILKTLIYWTPPHIQILLKYITEKFEDYPQVQLSFAKIMKRLHSEQLIFYLAQIIQSLACRSGQLIKQFLTEYAQQSVLFAHQLIWLAKVESKIDQDHKRPPSPKSNGKPQDFNILQSTEYQAFVADQVQRGHVTQKQLFISRITPIIIQKVIRNMDSEQTAFFNKVNNFFEKVTAISGVLRPQMSKADKRDLIAQELKKIELTQDIYMPTNPRFQITAIKLDSGTPMQSAAKCPILVSFYCRRFEGPDKYFEKKLKLKKELMLKMEKTVKEQQRQQLFDMDPMPDDEEKGPLFINELIRPIQGSKKRQSMQSSSHSQFASKQQMERKQSMEDRLHEMEHKKNLVREQTQINMSQQNQSPIELKSCIFKVFDDIRQDVLALQIIEMFKGVFERCGLELYVFPYKCISNRTGAQLNVGGIIEVIPNTISRDQMGKINRCNLYEYFINKFGPEDSLAFQVARENFIKSQAAYSIISYILQIKDRHNGNILISDKGHLIHIDFGFIFDISPGGNLKFESANFKLTKEMIQIMGRSQDSEAFIYYMDQTVRAFIAIRQYYEHMFYIVKLMVGSGLNCFMKDSLKNFTERFQLRKNDLAAAKYMVDIIKDAYDKSTTKWYDDIQFYQNGISR